MITHRPTDVATVRRDGWHQPTTRRLVQVLGLVVAAMGAEHGLGEVLQGDRRLAGPVIQSWPDSRFFRIEAGDTWILPLFVAAAALSILATVAARASDAAVRLHSTHPTQRGRTR